MSRPSTFGEPGRITARVLFFEGSEYLIDPATGLASFVAPLSGTNGHALALDPSEPGVLYHRASGAFEKIDLATLAVTPIGLSGVFRFFDNGGRYYTMQHDGTVSLATQVSATYFGLAYTDAPTPIILFRDGFETGDSSNWSFVTP